MTIRVTYILCDIACSGGGGGGLGGGGGGGGGGGHGWHGGAKMQGPRAILP